MMRNLITPGKVIISGMLLIGLLFTAILVLAMDDEIWIPPGGDSKQSGNPASQEQAINLVSATQTQFVPIVTPTPDLPRTLPPLRQEVEQYIVQPNDSLHNIARNYSVSVEALLAANDISQPDYLEIGQKLTIPAPQPQGVAPGFKIIPNSELVYSPASADFHLAEFVHQQGGYLSSYNEEVNERKLSGVKIVQRVAEEFSVNPRLLLAVLEYQSGWVTKSEPAEETLDYPIGILVEWRKGLYNQLAWAADNLNRGYYLWRVNGVPVWILSDGTLLSIDPSINAGTAGVQHFFSQLYDGAEWEQAVSPGGLFATYNELFGYPFLQSIDPLVPAGLTQPTMQLPFEQGISWSFTGGPHGGWGSGSAWAALDFAPPGDVLGCVDSDAWIVAVADGVILRAENGAVVQDLDNDGLEQTGWTVLYMHVDSNQRVRAGTYVPAGGQIGHPSCEGGVSSGTHLHLARRYNGEWISADQDLPFILDGWTSIGAGYEYDGYLVKDGQTIEAWDGRDEINEIKR
ncbi:MAG: LysM peptidoglycan-binding domain-containing protein [Anaerolineales bacterium]